MGIPSDLRKQKERIIEQETKKGTESIQEKFPDSFEYVIKVIEAEAEKQRQESENYLDPSVDRETLAWVFEYNLAKNQRLRWDIIKSYGKVLGDKKGTYGRESDLPYSKELIRKAIVMELLTNTEKDEKITNALETSYLCLEDFLSDDEFKSAQPFYGAMGNAYEKIKGGIQVDPVEMAQSMIKEDGGKSIIMDGKVSKRRHVRLQQLQKLKSVKTAMHGR